MATASVTTTKRISAFLLSLVSPVLHKSVCGSFSESQTRRVELEDVDPVCFQRVLDLWCGLEGVEVASTQQLMQTAGVAERFQVGEVGWALEEAMVGQLSVETCAEVLMGSGGLGLVRAEAAAEAMALGRFEEVAGTEGYLEVGEEALGRLVDDDRLSAGSEERVFECVLRWMAGVGCEGCMRGRGPLGKVRFPLMEAGYLAIKVEGLAPAEHREWARGAVSEAFKVKFASKEKRGMMRMEQLGARAGSSRVGMGVRWERYGGGGEGRRVALASGACSVAECGGWMCFGCKDGTMAVWDRATLTLERTLPASEGSDEVWYLAVGSSLINRYRLLCRAGAELVPHTKYQVLQG